MVDVVRSCRKGTLRNGSKIFARENVSKTATHVSKLDLTVSAGTAKWIARSGTTARIHLQLIRHVGSRIKDCRSLSTLTFPAARADPHSRRSRQERVQHPDFRTRQPENSRLSSSQLPLSAFPVSQGNNVARGAAYDLCYRYHRLASSTLPYTSSSSRKVRESDEGRRRSTRTSRDAADIDRWKPRGTDWEGRLLFWDCWTAFRSC